jgi:SOS-response transcriptional repressor LexA
MVVDLNARIDEAYSWLNKFEPTNLGSAMQVLVSQMNEAVQAQNVSQAWSIFQRLKASAPEIENELELAETLVESARAIFKIGITGKKPDTQVDPLEEAANLLETAVEHYSARPHQLAVTQWMLGYVLWSKPVYDNRWVTAWQESLETFTELAQRKPISYRKLSAKEILWYQTMIPKFQEELRLLNESDYLPATPEPKQRVGIGKRQRQIHSMLRIFPVLQEIPAGDPKGSGFSSEPIAYVEIERMTIDGEPYRVETLQSSKVVRVTNLDDCVVLKVSGDSMDQAGIADGDYILVRRQDDARSSEIVAVEIVGEDTRATLKEFIKRGKKIVLRPNSSNAEHVERVFSREEDGFHIRGIALAVLKPLEE